MPADMSFSWDNPNTLVIAFAEHVSLKMRRLTNTLGTIWFEDAEGQAINIPDGVSMREVVDRNAALFSPGPQVGQSFLFEQNRSYQILRGPDLKLNFGNHRRHYVFALNGATVAEAQPPAHVPPPEDL